MNKTYGPFTITQHGPYPVWTSIEYAGREIGGIRHSELADLHSAIGRAMQEARLLLKEDAREV